MSSTPILEKNFHNIKRGDTLHLAQCSFPFPPFYKYTYELPEGITGIVQTQSSSRRFAKPNTSGSTSYYTIYFQFDEVGTFHFTFKRNTDTPELSLKEKEFEHNITVQVSKN
jgi:hypothetical protein